MRRVKNPFCLDPEETSCPRLAKKGLVWNPENGTLEIAPEPEPSTPPPPAPKKPSRIDELRRTGAFPKIGDLIIPLSPNVPGLTKNQYKASKLPRASTIYFEEGFDEAQKYLGDEYRILEPWSGYYHIAVFNRDDKVEIGVRGIEPTNRFDIQDLYTLTTNPEEARSYQDVLKITNELEVERISGFSRGGSVALLVGEEKGIYAYAINPAVSKRIMGLSGKNAEVIRTTGDFASSLLGLNNPFKTYVVEAIPEYKDDPVSQHLLRNILADGDNLPDVYGTGYVKPQVDFGRMGTSAFGGVGLGLGIADVVYKSRGQSDRGVSTAGAVAGEIITGIDAPQMSFLEGGSSDIDYFMDRTGFTASMRTNTRKEQDEQEEFIKQVRENLGKGSGTKQPVGNPETFTMGGKILVEQRG